MYCAVSTSSFLKFDADIRRLKRRTKGGVASTIYMQKIVRSNNVQQVEQVDADESS